MTSKELHRGVFISIEGGDGVGKSTQVERLAQWLEEHGRSVVRTCEPGGTALGKQIREMLLHSGEVSPRAEAMLYAADRAHHVSTVVRPHLAAGYVVITDRYLDSSVAYQGAARELGPNDVRNLSLWAVEGLLPDLTIVLDCDPRIGATRRRGRLGSLAEADRLERESYAFHDSVRAQFSALAAHEPERFAMIDASSPADDVFALVLAAVQERLPGIIAADKTTGTVRPDSPGRV